MEIKGLKLKNISKEFKTDNSKGLFKAVDNVDIEINPGEMVTLLGPSGCGKTTILRMIAGFEKPTIGEIYIGEEDVTELPANKRDTAMVFQSYALFPHYTVTENIEYGLKIKKVGKEERKRRVDKILGLIGLTEFKDRYPGQLSGGQQQRVALARALVTEPAVLLFDEPLSNLDAKLRIHMRTEIRKIQKELKLTSVYVTHDQAEAMTLSDRVIIMNKGIIEQVGTPREIYQYPESEFVADFIGEANFIDGKVTEISVKNENEKCVNIDILGNKKEVILKNSKINKGDNVRVVLRPEVISIGEGKKYEGIVLSSVFMGEVQEYIIKIEDKNLFAKVINPKGKKVYSIDDIVNFDFEGIDIHILRKK